MRIVDLAPEHEAAFCVCLEEWSEDWAAYRSDGMLDYTGDRIELTRKGLLHADALLPAFFEPEHQGVRYT